MIAGVPLALAVAETPRALAADAVAAVEPDAASVAPKDDYYTRRARSVLAAEKAAAPKPHPLAAKYPGMDVVVCEAGCPEGSGAHVVSVRSAAEIAAAREARMVPTSDTDRGPPPQAAETPDVAACVAGCYADSEAEMAAVPESMSDADVGTSSAAPTVVSETPSPRPQRDKFSPIR